MSKIQDEWVMKVCGDDKGLIFNWEGIQYWLGFHDHYGIWDLFVIQNGFPVRGVDTKFYHRESEDRGYASLRVTEKVTMKEVFQTLEKEDLTIIEMKPLHYFWMFLYGFIEVVKILFEGKWYSLEYEGESLVNYKWEDLRRAEKEGEEIDTSFTFYPSDSNDYTYFDSVEELLNSHIISPSKTVQQVLLEADHIHFT